MTTQTLTPEPVALDPQHLSQNLKRYLAQELLDELRNPRWQIVAVDDTYTPGKGPAGKEKPQGGPIGGSISAPRGAVYALKFTVEKVYELEIYSNHYVLLEALGYERWEKRHMTGHAVILERLLGNRRTVFEQALSGYGNSKRPIIRLRGSKDDADAITSLLELCHVYQVS